MFLEDHVSVIYSLCPSSFHKLGSLAGQQWDTFFLFSFQKFLVFYIFFSHLTGNFNSYLLNPYYVSVNMLSFIYIIYFDLYNNIELVLLSPFKGLGN